MLEWMYRMPPLSSLGGRLLVAVLMRVENSLDMVLRPYWRWPVWVKMTSSVKWLELMKIYERGYVLATMMTTPFSKAMDSLSSVSDSSTN
jgi:hypothetical protein